MPGTTFIRAWRLYRRKTLEQLADEIGVTHGALSRIERGIRPYKQPILEAIAADLDCHPADLLARDPNDDDETWSVWTTLSPIERRRILGAIRALRADDTGGRPTTPEPARPPQAARMRRPFSKRAAK